MLSFSYMDIEKENPNQKWLRPALNDYIGLMSKSFLKYMCVVRHSTAVQTSPLYHLVLHTQYFLK